eukprot:TRINITY_DN112682_c0_g1_i1.p1 TRINITY_DN112682_c0_g1~~TRINITY_DN112682_c0_g1_i1.p1  ORF type:complete len:404 (+),score=82.86 TRINITY_DN112682_c0_g1_i1:160-1371(+)
MAHAAAARCNECYGLGVAMRDERSDCPDCQGMGTVPNGSERVLCTRCKGVGEQTTSVEVPCPTCAGRPPVDSRAGQAGELLTEQDARAAITALPVEAPGPEATAPQPGPVGAEEAARPAPTVAVVAADAIVVPEDSATTAPQAAAPPEAEAQEASADPLRLAQARNWLGSAFSKLQNAASGVAATGDVSKGGTQQRSCSACEGRGVNTQMETTQCVLCEGRGSTRESGAMSVVCRVCKGSGEREVETEVECSTCGGSGRAGQDSSEADLERGHTAAEPSAQTAVAPPAGEGTEREPGADDGPAQEHQEQAASPDSKSGQRVMLEVNVSKPCLTNSGAIIGIFLGLAIIVGSGGWFAFLFGALLLSLGMAAIFWFNRERCGAAAKTNEGEEVSPTEQTSLPGRG